MKKRGLRLSELLLQCKHYHTILKEGTIWKLDTCSGLLRCLDVVLFDVGW